MRLHYFNLSMKEASEILKSLDSSAHIITNTVTYYQKKESATNEDGITSGSNENILYNYFICGKLSGITNQNFLNDYLTNTDFIVEV